jgi:hypothetical protein
MNFKKCRTRKDIENDPRVEFVSYEDTDGIWIYLKHPYFNTFCGVTIIHEWTIKDCLEQLNEYVIENPSYWSTL